MLAGEGLHPSSKGARVKFSGAKRTVIDGPFTETKELVAGFWLIQVKSKEEAIEWVKRVPNRTCRARRGRWSKIRQVFEAEALRRRATRRSSRRGGASETSAVDLAAPRSTCK